MPPDDERGCPDSEFRAAPPSQSDAEDYSQSSAPLPISPDHLAMLAASGITLEHAALRGYETITDPQPPRRAGDRHSRPPLRPRPAGADTATRRLDVGLPVPARQPAATRRQARQIRDAVAAAQRSRRTARGRADSSATRRSRCSITEGAKKADSGAMHGLCIVALSGAWNWLRHQQRRRQGGVRRLARRRAERPTGRHGVRRRRGTQTGGAASD